MENWRIFSCPCRFFVTKKLIINVIWWFPLKVTNTTGWWKGIANANSVVSLLIRKKSKWAFCPNNVFLSTVHSARLFQEQFKSRIIYIESIVKSFNISLTLTFENLNKRFAGILFPPSIGHTWSSLGPTIIFSVHWLWQTHSLKKYVSQTRRKQ